MEISLSTHLFVFHDIDETVASLFGRFGFASAELWGMPPHFPYRDTPAADGIAALLARHGVRIASLHAPLYPDVRTYKKDRWYSLSAEGEGRRRESVEATGAAGAWLARGGGGTLVVHTQFPAEDWYPGRWAAFLSSMNELLDLLPENVRIAVENTPLPSGTVDVVMDIAARYPPGRVGVCLDLGHAHIAEHPIGAIRMAASRLIHVHASDNRGDRDDHLVPGRGTIPWKEVVQTLREVGYGGPFTVELRDYGREGGLPHGTFDDMLAECRAALDRFLGGEA